MTLHLAGLVSHVRDRLGCAASSLTTCGKAVRLQSNEADGQRSPRVGPYCTLPMARPTIPTTGPLLRELGPSQCWMNGLT